MNLNSKIYLGKNIFVKICFLLLSLVLVQCSSEKNFETDRYTLNIVSSKIPEQKDFFELASGFIHGDIASLPDKDSKIIFAGCSDLPEELLIFVQHPCTPTQITAGTCDSTNIRKQVAISLSNISFSDLHSDFTCSDSIQEKKITRIIENRASANQKIYLLSEASIKEQLLSFNDTSYNHLFNNLDSLKAAIERDVLSQNNNIIVIYYPPTRKGDQSVMPIFQKPPKEKPKNQTPVRDASGEVTPKKSFKITTENKTFFEWTDLGQGVKYDYSIVDYDSPNQKLSEASGLKENTLEVPNNLVNGRQYTLTVIAKRVGKEIKSKDCIFTVDENGNIIQDCKK